MEGGGYDHLRGSIILDSMPIEDVCCVPELAPAKLRRGNSVPDINSMKRAIARHQQQEEQTVGRSACHQDAEDAPSLRKMLARSRLGKMQAPERTPSSIDSDAVCPGLPPHLLCTRFVHAPAHQPVPGTSSAAWAPSCAFRGFLQDVIADV